jgi:imidazolonepropionase-like amidohydrolase
VIEVGSFADIQLVEGNPIEKIRVIEGPGVIGPQ